MAQLASLNWGLEVGVLRSTHLALVTSLIQYGLVTFGSHIYEKQLDRLDTQVINVAARRITGAQLLLCCLFCVFRGGERESYISRPSSRRGRVDAQ